MIALGAAIPCLGAPPPSLWRAGGAKWQLLARSPVCAATPPGTSRTISSRGLTVGQVALPLAMAFAIASGVPPQLAFIPRWLPNS
jgi:hypothetical protein